MKQLDYVDVFVKVRRSCQEGFTSRITWQKRCSGYVILDQTAGSSSANTY